jgi:protein-tyrosine-phosphatase/putative NADPH-quinone reductase
MAEAGRAGAVAHTIDVDQHRISPCKEYLVCEKKGDCPIDDEMRVVYGQLRRADVVLMASPVFFYNLTAQIKALIDRCQVFWARKYRLKLKDPGAGTRRGALLSVAATRGSDLFKAADVTARYFFDALDARYEGSLTYRGIEHRGDMAAHPGVEREVKDFMVRLLAPYAGRKRVLFTCRENACLSQMAGAYAQVLAGDTLEVLTGGSEPASVIDPAMAQALAEHGVDMAFRSPRSIEAALAEGAPDWVITMGGPEVSVEAPGAQRTVWDLPEPKDMSPARMRELRDDVKKRVVTLLEVLK